MRLPPFTALDWAVWVAEMATQVAVLATALRLPRRDRPHLWLFAGNLAAEVFARTAEALYLERVAVPGAPPVGAARALYHTVQALSTAWPAAVAVLTWWCFRGRRAWPIGVAWLAFNAALIAAHPLPRGWTQPALHAFAGACVLAAGAAIVPGWARRRERAATVALWLAGLEFVIATAGPYARNVFASWRTVGGAVYAFGFFLLAALQFIWGRRSTPAR